MIDRHALAARLAARLAPHAPAPVTRLAAPPTIAHTPPARIERLSDTVTLYLGDSRDVVPQVGPVHAVVTDPPYALVSITKRFGKPGSAPAQSGATGVYARASAGFMGQAWDTGETAFDPAFWALVLAQLSPGGHVVAASGTRTYHRLACAVEDAGAEIRDMVSWLYGSGFPKSHDVSAAIDKAAGAATARGAGFNVAGQNVGLNQNRELRSDNPDYVPREPITDAAREWDGWGTALKPACEPWVLARRPLAGTVAQNVLAHRTGALWIDGCRVGGDAGRWPANVAHDGSDAVLAGFPQTRSGKLTADNQRNGGFAGTVNVYGTAERGGTGEYAAARFFYCAKASRADRNEGDADNAHPTVKPTDLMRWLCRLVTPPGGIVLDPFMGSGSTGKAAVREGFGFVGIERDPAYWDIARRRIEHALTQRP